MEEDEACDFISMSDWSKKRLSRCGDCSGEVRDVEPRGDSGPSNRCASVGGGLEDAEEDEEVDAEGSGCSVRGGWGWGCGWCWGLGLGLGLGWAWG